mmetsp:Transcript_11436/g.21793  ORF Transcript_11436/g.21793 Transcript_11436/m.21793 type:complete len:464 (+) Transcript_11436:338-1729(+)
MLNRLGRIISRCYRNFLCGLSLVHTECCFCLQHHLCGPGRVPSQCNHLLLRFLRFHFAGAVVKLEAVICSGVCVRVFAVMCCLGWRACNLQRVGLLLHNSACGHLLRRALLQGGRCGRGNVLKALKLVLQIPQVRLLLLVLHVRLCWLLALGRRLRGLENLMLVGCCIRRRSCINRSQFPGSQLLHGQPLVLLYTFAHVLRELRGGVGLTQSRLHLVLLLPLQVHHVVLLVLLLLLHLKPEVVVNRGARRARSRSVMPIRRRRVQLLPHRILVPEHTAKRVNAMHLAVAQRGEAALDLAPAAERLHPLHKNVEVLGREHLVVPSLVELEEPPQVAHLVPWSFEALAEQSREARVHQGDAVLLHEMSRLELGLLALGPVGGELRQLPLRRRRLLPKVPEADVGVAVVVVALGSGLRVRVRALRGRVVVVVAAVVQVDALLPRCRAVACPVSCLAALQTPASLLE